MRKSEFDYQALLNDRLDRENKPQKRRWNLITGYRPSGNLAHIDGL